MLSQTTTTKRQNVKIDVKLTWLTKQVKYSIMSRSNKKCLSHKVRFLPSSSPLVLLLGDSKQIKSSFMMKEVKISVKYFFFLD